MPRESVITEAIRCCQCGRLFRNLNQFHKTCSGIYSGTGHLPICNSCFSDIYKIYVENYESERLAMQRLCMNFDLYYSDKIFDSSIDENGELTLGNYIKNLNMRQHKGRTFETTLNERKEVLWFARKSKTEEVDNSKSSSKPNNTQIKEEDILSEDVKRWGYGFDKVDYNTLNSHYEFLTKANPNCDSNQEIFINDLCITKMLQTRAVKNGDVDAYNKLTESYRKSFQQAGLKTVKDTSSTEDFSFGVNCEMIEKYTPAEYYKNKELYKDHDDLGGYCERFILRPLRNLIHGTKDRDFEFYVKDEGDTNESDE